jgi:predicted transcriptional regulator
MTMLVDSATESVIRKYQKSAPVDVISLAKDLGIKVWQSEKLGPGISGKLFKDAANGGSSGWSILVRESDAPARKRFTVAHEIGHFVLHRPALGDGITDDEFYRSGLSNAQEAQANRLAADILMPYRLINELTASGITSIDLLAAKLGVSLTALKIRLGQPI